MLTDTTKPDRKDKLAVILEAARRANWDALHGPEHLRSGRFDPRADQQRAPKQDRNAAKPKV